MQPNWRPVRIMGIIKFKKFVVMATKFIYEGVGYDKEQRVGQYRVLSQDKVFIGIFEVTMHAFQVTYQFVSEKAEPPTAAIFTGISNNQNFDAVVAEFETRFINFLTEFQKITC